MAARSRTRIVGVTGGIATGKSTLLGMFRRLGVACIDSDAIAHRLMKRGGRVYSDVLAVFGDRYLDASGEIDRRALGCRIFSSRPARRALERIVHPAVFAEIARRIRHFRRRGRGIVAVDIPLLFETRAEPVVDEIVLAYAPRSVQVERLRRRGISPAAAAARLRAQWSIGRKRARSDKIFDMRRSLREIRREVRTWLRQGK